MGKVTTPPVLPEPAKVTVEESASFSPVIVSFPIRAASKVPLVIFVALRSGMSAATRFSPAVTIPRALTVTFA